MTKYRIVLTGAFKKDLKTAVNRGYDMDLLGRVVDTLAQGKPLPEKYRDTLCGEIIKGAESVT